MVILLAALCTQKMTNTTLASIMGASVHLVGAASHLLSNIDPYTWMLTIGFRAVASAILKANRRLLSCREKYFIFVLIRSCSEAC